MTLYVESIRNALDRSMANNPAVCLIGEDLLDPYGGAFKATKGLSSKYPGRVHATPISESAIIGIATGMAMRGMRPVAEIMFGDFLTLCADQIVNSATKFPLMYKGSVQVPLVIRTPVAGARGYGPTHSQSLEKMFFGVPGLSVIAPNELANPGYLLEQAICKGDSPILFIEDKADYSRQVVPSMLLSLTIDEVEPSAAYPTIRAQNFADKEHAADVVIIAYGGGASIAARAMEDLKTEEIRCTLFAPTAVNDVDTLRTVIGALPCDIPILIAEQGTHGFGWASELMALMLESGRSRPSVRRVAAQPGIIPAARHLEADVILGTEKIKNAIFEVLS